MIVVLIAAFLSYSSVISAKDCLNIQVSDRLDCHPEVNASPEKCQARNCCWNDQVKNENVPFCFFPLDFPAYKVVDEKIDERYQNFTLQKTGNLMRPEFKEPIAMIHYETDSRMRIKIFDQAEKRWEPEMEYSGPSKTLENNSFKTQIRREPFGLRIYTNDKEILDFNAYLSSSLILSDQFLQLSLRLNTEYGFGLGEHRKKFPLKFDTWDRIAFWNRDQPPMENGNLYGVHNFLLALDVQGNSFGVFFLNSNAQEVVIQPNKVLTYRTTGGILDFYIFSGPTPLEVIQQYHRLIGFTQMPPKWAFGYHLSRYGYSGTEEARKVYKRNTEAGIELGAFWVDIDYMDAYKDWTIDNKAFKNYSNFISNEVRASRTTRHVIIVDPAIKIESNYPVYEEAKDLGIFIRDSKTGLPIIGKVWPGETNFPDFSNPKAFDWWLKSASEFNKTLIYDGLWIDMNEPSSFDDGSKTGCDPNNKLDNPEYVPPVLEGSLFSKTLCPSSLHHDTTNYNRHNLYGYDEAKVTRKVLETMNPDERPFILTRSSFSGSGRYTNHWTGDNFATWQDLRASIKQIINFNLFGIPMVGADVCGFIYDTNEELCTRWHQLAVFYPFFRNHNTKGAKDQDPASFSKETLNKIVLSIYTRKLVIPMIYSLMFDSHLEGGSVVNAMAFVFPEDEFTHDIDTQFMLGKCLIVSPIIESGQKTIETYLPKGYWFSFYHEKMVYSKGEFVEVEARDFGIEVHTKGGCVTFWPVADYGYIVQIYLNNPNPDSEALGYTYFDDDKLKESNILKVKVTAKNQVINISSEDVKGRYTPVQGENLANFVIYNVAKRPIRVRINGKVRKFFHVNNTLYISRIFHDLRTEGRITWEC